MRSEPLDVWLYHKIFLGSALDRMDSLILHLASEMSTEPDIARWFYLRYFEEGGLHLRVRVQCTAGSSAHLLRRLEPKYSAALLNLSQMQAGTYRPMLLASALPLEFAFDAGTVRMSRDVYEPEFERFGGTAGMGIAEDLFAASTIAAVSVLKHEVAGYCSRKTIAPLYMQAVYDAFNPVEPAEEFWSSYANHWLSSMPAPAAGPSRATFREKAEEIIGRGVPIFVEPAQLPSQCAATVEIYRQALRLAAERYGRIPDPPTAALRGRLAASFVHLMNNRLGFNVLEEAYLATLCEHAFFTGDRKLTAASQFA